MVSCSSSVGRVEAPRMTLDLHRMQCHMHRGYQQQSAPTRMFACCLLTCAAGWARCIVVVRRVIAVSRRLLPAGAPAPSHLGVVTAGPLQAHAGSHLGGSCLWSLLCRLVFVFVLLSAMLQK